MKRIALSLLTISVVGAMVVGATAAYFLDTETSNGNTFAAGSLDLTIEGSNTNVVKFNVTDMRPGNQPKRTYHLENVGTIDGFLDLENVSVTDHENSCVDPEEDAGDVTCGDPGAGEGELDEVVNLRLFVDYGCDGWISVGDVKFYDDYFSNLPTHFELDEPLAAGDNLCIVALADWWSTAMDDQAQGDDMMLDMTFELGQTAAQ